MKITLERTQYENVDKITIENKRDDFSPDDWMVVFRTLLYAWGFDEETINKYISKDFICESMNEKL